ncbi:hypothetical protein ISS37_02375 [candidate division KSB1 bacterium]|nr:hypothetical protein [candidate division KSB1 bacterium]
MGNGEGFKELTPNFGFWLNFPIYTVIAKSKPHIPTIEALIFKRAVIIAENHNMPALKPSDPWIED